ncbi:MAG TPA: hypothetical protein VKA87_11705, partial [Nitrososphaeraceae archaeon]|nr:hypothetical protein [Nitrososphaeraceae archaeon]
MSGRCQLFKTSQYCIAKMGLVVIALLTIIITPTFLQPLLATATSLPPTNTTTYDDNNNEYNTVTLAPSNQSNSFADKSNITLRGLFTDLGESRRWIQLLQPALDELNRRHSDMNIQLEYTDFLYNETRNEILDRISHGESVDIISVDQIWLG